MLYSQASSEQKRSKLKQELASGKLLRFPGAFSPLVASLVERIGFDGVYISGAVISANLALPDVGLTTLSEVETQGREISRATELPCIIDIETGFGEPVNVARSVQALEDAGVAACHLEDQRNPKRCGHLDNKQIVSTEEMLKKVKAAVSARRCDNFTLIARTDARASEGLDKAIERAKSYVDAGADVIFPEALQDESEFEAFRKNISVPLLANMTEFGKSKILNKTTLEKLGFNIVIYPVTSLRLAMKAVEDGLLKIFESGTQEQLLEQMQTRSRLYEVLNYKEYQAFDSDIFNFKLEDE
jgi:methylisocitrate lyase